MHAVSHEPPVDSRTDELLIERSDFQLRLANNRGRRSRESVLIQRMYSWRPHEAHAYQDPAYFAGQVTLQACRGNTVFGTLTVDSGATLAADGLYRSEIDAYRSAGARVCELTQLALSSERGSKDVIGALFHLAHLVCLARQLTDVFIEVSPRHAGFYRRMLEFRQLGTRKICPHATAPVVLLYLEVAYVSNQVALYGGHRGRGKRSLYPYFFSTQEARGLLRRILGSPGRARVTAEV